jgi:hypothetical protein
MFEAQRNRGRAQLELLRGAQQAAALADQTESLETIYIHSSCDLTYLKLSAHNLKS